ncbi:peptidyl-prolyl cis-trans isomerase B (cyclophilin B) [Quadrisphaera granulorum]|uniref:Peptidyl-prolyl cis-trans isomerase B (Cyclophilin B) n=1 Tax=Quadrisphaera granulorum TaxID=317664 RepID=A0A316A7S8_9ACTN|nr:peptidylprolyl isomerase [Quadrisphaera granulorum]PWJ53542.1 peptidyl-prolyl cis-trans isomerase B (cyclophilin B) [Quadrisphaera granulorum]SZE96884.1 peptidyl-prolyl cis-trans isomerase B (cyclophilin B) [Quadrisphaera granulorum]
MPPSKSERERDYERRRHQAWQRRQAAKAAERRRRRNTAIAATLVVVVLAGIAVVAWFSFRPSAADEAAAPGASPSAAATTSASPPANACPAPTSTPDASATQLSSAPDPSVAQGRTWAGTLVTSCGDIGVELDGAKAPRAVASFVTLARDNFFNGTPCHRLTTSGIYVLQCGDPTGTGTGGPGYTFGPVEAAPSDNVYPAGTIAMARRGSDGDSQGSQFFLVYQDSTIPSDTAGGYTVLGRITSGLDVVQRVASAGDDGSNGPGDGKPTTPISIEQVTVQ